MPDQFDVSLEDSDLLGEVELTTNLIIAASETDEHLSDAEIDEILGVAAARRRLIPQPRQPRLGSTVASAGREEHRTGAEVREHARVRPRLSAASPPESRARSPTSPGTGRRRCRPGPVPAPRERGPRVGVGPRASSSANSKATRTRAVRLVGHRERRVRVDLPGLRERAGRPARGPPRRRAPWPARRRRSRRCRPPTESGSPRRRRRRPTPVARAPCPCDGCHGDGEVRRASRRRAPSSRRGRCATYCSSPVRRGRDRATRSSPPCHTPPSSRGPVAQLCGGGRRRRRGRPTTAGGSSPPHPGRTG